MPCAAPAANAVGAGDVSRHQVAGQGDARRVLDEPAASAGAALPGLVADDAIVRHCAVTVEQNQPATVAERQVIQRGRLARHVAEDVVGQAQAAAPDSKRQ
jgi:hypothetical protein